MEDGSFSSYMQQGREALSRNELHASARFFGAAGLVAGKSDALRAEALQMGGVAYRKRGKIHTAIRYGREAVRLATPTGQLRLISATMRDLAMSLHVMAVTSKKDREENLTEARKLFEDALENDHRATAAAGRIHDAQYFVTRGVLGLLYFDRAHYRCLVEGERPNFRQRQALRKMAYLMLDNASYKLRHLDNRTWELDTLLRFAQISPFWKRSRLSERINELLALFPERKNDVRVAYLGRRVMRVAIKYKVWSMARKRRA